MNQEKVTIAKKAKKLCKELDYAPEKIISLFPEEDGTLEFNELLGSALTISIFHQSTSKIGFNEDDINDAIDVYVSCYVHDITDGSLVVAEHTISAWIVAENIDKIPDGESKELPTWFTSEYLANFMNFKKLLTNLMVYNFSSKDLMRTELIYQCCYEGNIPPDICSKIALYWLKGKFKPN